MITLDDCQAFGDADVPDVARMAREQQIPIVVAIARAHARKMQAPLRDPQPQPYPAVSEQRS